MKKAQCVFFGGVILVGWGDRKQVSHILWFFNLCYIYKYMYTYMERLYMHIHMYSKEEFPYIEKYLT